MLFFRYKRLFFFFLLPLLLAGSCRHANNNESESDRLSREVVVEWNKLLLELERFTPGYRAPVSARMFAYMSIAAYETALPGNPGYISTGKYWPECQVPAYTVQQTPYSVPAGLNAAYGFMARKFFTLAPYELKKRIDELEQHYTEKAAEVSPEGSCSPAIQHGLATAAAVWEWSATDTMGHNGCFFCFDRNFHPSQCPSCWQPDSDQSVPPLLPHWGKVRTFCVSLSDLSEHPPLEYSEAPGSSYYNQAMEIFSMSQPLSKDNQWIAEYWSDDIPELTVTPAGRWISINTQAIEQKCPPFNEVLELYLRNALALNDAMVINWALKYQYNLQRPGTYIRAVIHKNWQPYLENPSFPAYPAGHAMLGAAAAEILTAGFGDAFSFTDNTHKGRTEFAGMPRTYPSFHAMAQENALSRLVAGVHFRMDCDEGMRLGKEIGLRVAALPLR